MTEHTASPRRRRRLAVGITIAIVVLMPLAFSAAQQLVGGTGHALDANLQLGSGGYNRPVQSSGYMSRQRYTAGSTRPLWVVDRNGNMVYSPHNAFTPRAPYVATGYTGDYLSRSSYRRFRYSGQY